MSRHGKGICAKVPILGKSRSRVEDQDRFWSCSHSAFQHSERATEKDYKEGNYVKFRVLSQERALYIIEMNDRYCNPPEKECSRDNLIDKMLTAKDPSFPMDDIRWTPDIRWNDIHFDYNSDTCQFILRAAEKLGFKYASIINRQVEGDCADIKEVDSDSKEYESSPIALCEGYKKFEGFFLKCKAKRIALSKTNV